MRFAPPGRSLASRNIQRVTDALAHDPGDADD
jgi:hypothetical protein